MRHFYIFSGGTLDDEFVCRMIDREKPDVMIAADRGMDFFYRNNRKPDVIVGDFDSTEGESLTFFKTQSDVSIVELCPMKDDTDTEAAVCKAIAMGAEQITIFGATGCRLDHVLGNIELLGIGLKAGVPMALVDTTNRIRMIESGISISKSEQHGTYVSLLPYTSKVEHLTLQGFKYPLNDATLEGFCTLGVSNEIVDKEAKILFDGGILIVIESRDEK